MIPIEVDASSVNFEDQALLVPAFNAEHEERFNELLASPDENIWALAQSEKQIFIANYEETPSTSPKPFSPLPLLSDASTELTLASAHSRHLASEQAETMAHMEHSQYLETYHLGLVQFKAEMIERIQTCFRETDKRNYRLDELFKKVIRGLSSHLRQAFADDLSFHNIRQNQLTSEDMELVLSKFLKTHFGMNSDLGKQDLLEGKKVFYSIAMKSRQLEYGSEFSEIIKKLRCTFVDIGTKKSGMEFFGSRVGRGAIWPIFKDILTRALAGCPAAHLQKSFNKFIAKIEA